MNQVRIKLELVVDTDLNVSQVRGRLATIKETKILTEISRLVQSLEALNHKTEIKSAIVQVYSASYNTRFGVKPKC